MWYDIISINAQSVKTKGDYNEKTIINTRVNYAYVGISFIL